MKSLMLACIVAAAISGPVLAQDYSGHAGHAGMAGMAGMAMGEDSPATAAYKAANMSMHEDMEIDYSGNADVDFVRGMIPHHQGAIDMAKVVLEHGSDPDIKALAQGIIAAQEAEIAQMQAWLTAHPVE